MTTTLAAYPTFEANDDFKVFTERLENAFFINKTSPNDRVPILLNQIDASVYKTLRSLCDPEQPANKPFEDLCALLRRQYIRELSVWKARQQFFRAFQAQNEGATNWYLRLKELAADCGFGETLDAAIRCKFVAGLESSVAFNKIAEQGSSLTMDELLAIAMADEPVKNRNPRSRQRRGRSVENMLDDEAEEKVVAWATNQNENQSNYKAINRQRRGRSMENMLDEEEEEEIVVACDTNQNQRQSNDRNRRRRGRSMENTLDEEEDSQVLACDTNQNQSQRNNHNRQRRGRSRENTLDAANDNQSQYGNQKPLRLCWHCGEAGGHKFSTCVHKNSYCNFCHELGHLETVCRHMQPEVQSEIDKKLPRVFDGTKLTKQPPPAPIPEGLKLCPQCKCIGQLFAIFPNRPCSKCGYKGHMIDAYPPTIVSQQPVSLPRTILPVESSNPLNILPAQYQVSPLNVPPEQPTASKTIETCPHCGGTNHRFNKCRARQCTKCLKTGHLARQCYTRKKTRNRSNRQYNQMEEHPSDWEDLSDSEDISDTEYTEDTQDKCCVC